MSDDDFMMESGDDEDYDFQYEDDDEDNEEPDADIENKYYNAKGIKPTFFILYFILFYKIRFRKILTSFRLEGR